MHVYIDACAIWHKRRIMCCCTADSTMYNKLHMYRIELIGNMMMMMMMAHVQNSFHGCLGQRVWRPTARGVMVARVAAICVAAAAHAALRSQV
jgi:hypothetical protein